LSDNQSAGSASSVSLDFNTYQPEAGTYDPAYARTSAGTGSGVRQISCPSG